MSDFTDYIEANRGNWNDRAELHVRSTYYDVEGFVAGRPGLGEPEITEVGDVDGLRLLHLQCHIGLDTLAWARRGATVTGVDLSDEAIGIARSLADRTNIDARFIHSNIYELPSRLDEQFDAVVATHGILCWIPDVPRWMRVAAGYLAPGGFLYLADGHPLAAILSDDVPALDGDESYFYRSEPNRYEAHHSYVPETTTFDNPVSYEWNHDLGEIVSAVVESGLTLEFLHEHPYTCFQALPQMRLEADGRWHLPGDRLPLLFSLRAKRGA